MTANPSIASKKFDFLDYFFWIMFVLYSNPGGMLNAIGLISSDSGGGVKDLVIFSLFGCYLLSIILDKNIHIDPDYKTIVAWFAIFGIYYFLVFGYLVPSFKETLGYSLMTFLKKSRFTVYSFLIFLMTYRFYLRSGPIFFKTLIISSILAIFLFFLTVLAGIPILPIDKGNRNFVETERIFMVSYGMMHILIPIGAVVIVFFKHKFKWKKWLLIAFLFMFFAWVLSITRRRIIGTFIYIFIAVIIFNYIEGRALISPKKMLTIAAYVAITLFVVSLTFPKYLQAGYSGIQEVVQVAQTGETSAGSQDNRMGFGTKFLQKIIIDNKYFGTGFDNRWRTKEGDEQGFEAADYPFLAAIAMTGIFGVLSFLPIYILIVKFILYDLRFLRKHKVKYTSFELFGLLLLIVYFAYHLMQYMNWFIPVSSTSRYDWFAYLGIYLAARQLFYTYHKKTTSIT